MGAIIGLKHPGDKRGNNVYSELPPEALAIVKFMPRGQPENLSLLDRRHQRRFHTCLQDSWN